MATLNTKAIPTHVSAMFPSESICRNMDAIAAFAGNVASAGIRRLTLHDNDGSLPTTANSLLTLVQTAVFATHEKEFLGAFVQALKRRQLRASCLNRKNHILWLSVAAQSAEMVSENSCGSAGSARKTSILNESDNDSDSLSTTESFCSAATSHTPDYAIPLIEPANQYPANTPCFTFIVRFSFSNAFGYDVSSNDSLVPSTGSKSHILQVTKTLAKQAIEFRKSQLGSDEAVSRFSDLINVEFLHNIFVDADVGEPELMYVFGNGNFPLQLHSYPPWELRLTEICNIGGNGRPTFKDFTRGLDLYSTREKRVGK